MVGGGIDVSPFKRGFEAHGALYLLTLRLNPVIPYWLVNLAMGLTTMRPATYFALTIPGLKPRMDPVPDVGQHNEAIISELGLVKEP
mgnify:CR=1 FL=1